MKHTFFVVLAPCGCWTTSIHNDPAYASDIAQATRDAVKKGLTFKVIDRDEWAAITERSKTCNHGRQQTFSPDSFDALALELS